MTAMLLPSQSQYFAIYTVGTRKSAHGDAIWDLHATAPDKRTALDHARVLVLQPHVREVQVKEITENNSSGHVRVREIKRCKRGSHQARIAAAFMGVCVLALGLIYALI